MSLDLLDTPVRLTWDFPDSRPEEGEAALTGIAQRIVDGGVFFVTLQGAPLIHDDLPAVLDILRGRCQLLISCRGREEELSQLTKLSLQGCQLLLDVADFFASGEGLDSTLLGSVVTRLRGFGYEPVLSLTPLRRNLAEIPDLISFCTAHKVGKIKLPNAHIGDSFHEYSPDDLPRAEDLERFAEKWRIFAAEVEALPALEIHDLFLWEIMTPDQKQNRSEYGGCQAGNSLGHIDLCGTVHPCAAWPQALGSLPEESLDEIWSGSGRLLVREQIALTPSGCRGCRDLDICFGGCRGLSTHLNRAGGERDLMCSGPR